jgi:3-oxoacyl-[acyl-carrier protein] reductase
MGSLVGKVALVTGGSKGIGSAIARRLAREGADVAITYFGSQAAAIEVVNSIEWLGRRGIPIRADSGSRADVRRAVDETMATLGQLDILVNNAAAPGPGMVHELTLEEIDRVASVNIMGVYLAIKESIQHMKRGGRIINIGSVSSDYMPYSGHSLYSMTKGAVSGLTRGLARELGARGITINNVQPGRVDTDLLRTAVGEKLDAVTQGIAVQRLGDCEEIASFVAYLAGPEAGFVTGANLKIDGGVSV